MRTFAEVDPEEEIRKQLVGMSVEKSMSLPALPSASTWRNLDKLLQDHRSKKVVDPSKDGMSQKVADHTSAKLVEAVAHLSDNAAKISWQDNLMLRGIAANLVTSIVVPPTHATIVSMVAAAKEYERLGVHGFGLGAPEHFAFRGFVVGLAKAIKDKAEQQALAVGDRIEVVENMQTDNEKPCKLAKGSTGVVVGIGEHGDAQINFQGIIAMQWIYKDNFHKVKLQAHSILLQFAANLKHVQDFQDVVGTCFHRESLEGGQKARIWIQFLSKANPVKEIAKQYFDRQSDCEMRAMLDEKPSRNGAAKKLHKSLSGVQQLMKKL
jgi:hypothetical protein